MSIQRKINDIDIRLLRIFKTVAECGGFSAAETELNIARSTISTHMADLEARLNLVLCRRGRSGFSLTEDGKQVYQATLQVLSALEGFRSQMNALHNQLTGEINILCSDAIVSDTEHFKLTEVLESFAQAAPDVQINISADILPDIERALLDGRADIGFIPYHRQLSSLDYLPLYNESYNLHCHKKHPLFGLDKNEIDIDLINQQAFVHPGIQTNPQANKAIKQLNRKATAYHYETRLSLLSTGMYIGYFPSHYAKPLRASGELRELESPHHSYQASIAAAHKPGAGNKLLSLFLNHLNRAYPSS